MRRKGHKPVYRTFDTQLEAQKWTSRLEADIDTGFYVDNSAAEKMTLTATLEQYRWELALRNGIRHKRTDELIAGFAAIFATVP